MKLARAHQEAGRFGEASSLYEQILRVEPDNADALNNSGVLAHQTGKPEVAIARMTKAIERSSGTMTHFLNLGTIFETRGELDQAVANYRGAVSLDPWSESAHFKLGNALRLRGDMVEAAVCFSRALGINPDSAQTIDSLGIVLQQGGKLEQAVVCHRKAISLAPDYAEAHNNLATALDRLGRTDEAVASYRQAIFHKATLAVAHGNLGRALGLQGNLPEAIQSCLRAIELKPDLVDAHLDLGSSYRSLGLISEAVSSYQRLLSIAPEYGAAYNNLSESYMEQGKLAEAKEACESAISARIPFPPAYSNLLYLHALTRDVSHDAERAAAEGWEKTMLSDTELAAARLRASAASGVFPLCPLAGRKLRLGIVSGDFGTHAVAEFLEPILEQLDRNRFHLTLFATSMRAGPRAQHFLELADRYISLIGISDAQAAEGIRSEQIDVLIDTSGHTMGNRLAIFAHRAAPVQITYIGYWSTTGLTEMDWFFTDDGTDACYDAHFTEGLWRLPRLAVCYFGDTTLPESAWSPDPDGTVWLGSFNKYAKIREETLALWAQVLQALPEAKLLLEDRAAIEQETHRRILTTLAGHGIAETRVVFEPSIPGHVRHMVLYDHLDIALDTVPFNSGTTAFDALWMGVPLVALEGNWLGGKMGSVFVKTLGHPEWVARDAAEYASIVVALARDVEGRKALRKDQRALMAASPLCDAKGLTRALENAFEAMYSRWLGPTV